MSTTRTTRRTTLSIRLAAAAAGLLLSAGLAAVSVAGAGDADLPDVYEVRAEAGGIHDSIAIPAYFEMFFPYSMSEASNGSTHTLAAHWYGGFFLTAAAQFYGFPPFPGTTETLYPQGPEDGRVEFLPLPGGGYWAAQGHSEETHSTGWASYHQTDTDEPLRMAHGRAESAVDVTGEGGAGTASIEMEGVEIAGALRIGSVLADGSVLATGQPGTATATGRLTMLDVELAGVALEITPTGVRFADQDQASAPGDLEALFSETGISLRRLPDRRLTSADGRTAAVELGGVEVVVSRPGNELEVTYTIGRLRLSSRADRFEEAASTTTTLPPPPTRPTLPPTPVFEDAGSGGGLAPGGGVLASSGRSPAGAGPGAASGRAISGGEVAAPPGLSTQEIRRVTPASTGNWAGLAALLLLVTPGGLVVRRSLRGVNGS